MGHDTLKFVIALAALAVIVVASAFLVSGYFPAFGLGGKPAANPTPSAVSGGHRQAHGALHSPSVSPRNMTAGRSMPQPGNYQQMPAYTLPQPVQPQENAYAAYQTTGYQSSPGPSISSPSAPAQQMEEPTQEKPFLSGWESMIQQLFQYLSLIFKGSSSFFQEWSGLFKSLS